MPMNAQPSPGLWYETEEGDIFLVMTVEESKRTVEIWRLDGAFDEMDLESWYAMELQEIEPPEEWHASMDDFLSGRRRPPR